MKKITVHVGQPPRKLVAVIANTGAGIFFRSGDGNLFLDGSRYSLRGARSLEEIVGDLVGQPVYEGDSITIQF